MREVDLNLLGQLAVLLQTRSVTGAAQRLGMSQPAMSRSLAELRRAFGDPLLVRTRGGMLPTRRAEELAVPLRQWLADAKAMTLPRELDPSRLERRFRIAASDHAVRRVVAPALATIAAVAPAVALDVVAPSGDARARLAGGEVDLVLTAAPADPEQLHDRLLLSEAYACLAPIGHPLLAIGARRALTVHDLSGWPQVALTAADQPAGAPLLAGAAGGLRLVATLPHVQAAAGLAEACGAILILPESAAAAAAARGAVGFVPAPDSLGTFELRALWHNRSHRDPALHWLVGVLAGEDETGSAAPPLLDAAE